jgi:hypothetical protein
MIEQHLLSCQIRCCLHFCEKQMVLTNQSSYVL